MDNTKLLFPVLLLCDENGEYIDFTEDEIVSALEEANDSDVRYFKPTEEEESYFHRIYARLISEVQDQHAFQEALVCTNDPECLNNVPAGNNSNGAACHSCCMISETACENGNRMLDRGLIVPIDGRENQSYFKALVEELCQLEA